MNSSPNSKPDWPPISPDLIAALEDLVGDMTMKSVYAPALSQEDTFRAVSKVQGAAFLLERVKAEYKKQQPQPAKETADGSHRRRGWPDRRRTASSKPK
jgi:hypothetical protein